MIEREVFEEIIGEKLLERDLFMRKIKKIDIRSNSKIDKTLSFVYPSIAFNIPFNVTIVEAELNRHDFPRGSFIRQLAPPPIHKEQRERNSRAAVTGWLPFKKEWEGGEGGEKKRWHASIDEGKVIHRNERRNRFKVTLRVSLCERRDTWPSTAQESWKCSKTDRRQKGRRPSFLRTYLLPLLWSIHSPIYPLPILTFRPLNDRFNPPRTLSTDRLSPDTSTNIFQRKHFDKIIGNRLDPRLILWQLVSISYHPGGIWNHRFFTSPRLFAKCYEIGLYTSSWYFSIYVLFHTRRSIIVIRWKRIEKIWS